MKMSKISGRGGECFVYLIPARSQIVSTKKRIASRVSFTENLRRSANQDPSKSALVI